MRVHKGSFALWAFLSVLLSSFSSSDFAQAAPVAGAFTYQGRLTDTSDVPIVGVQAMEFEILNPAGTCLLYRETKSVTTDSRGVFATTIGSGTRAAPDPGLPIATVFQNAGSNLGGCYTPASGDARNLRIYVNGTALSDQILGAVPQAQAATYAESANTATNATNAVNATNATTATTATTATNLQGYVPTDFLGSGANTVAAANIQGNSIGLSKLDSAICANGEVLKKLAGAWTCSPDAAGGGLSSFNEIGTTPLTIGGTLTDPTLTIAQAAAGVDGYLSGADYNVFAAKVGSVAAADGSVTVGGTATAPTLRVATNGITGTNLASNITVSTTGNLTTTGTGTITSAGTLTASSGLTVTTGGASITGPTTITGAATITGATTLGGNVTMGPGRVLSLAGSTSGNVLVNAPASFTTYTLTLPSDDGAASQVLTTDGNGVLSWTTPSGGGGISSLGGATDAVQGLSTFNDNSILAPTWDYTSFSHRWKYPMAASAGVTAGLLSKTQYDVFNNAATTVAAASTNANPTTLAMRDAAGRLQVADPTSASEAASKQYVDTNLGAVASGKLGTALPNGQIFVGNGGVATATAMSGDAIINSAGVLSLSNTGVGAGTYTKVVVDARGRVTASAALVDADIPTLTSAGKVDGAAISGTIGGSTSINTTGAIVTSGNINANSGIIDSSLMTLNLRTSGMQRLAISNMAMTLSGLSITTAGTGDLRLSGGSTGVVAAEDVNGFRISDGTNYTTILPNSAGTYTLRLPGIAPVAGAYLQTDGAGNLTWNTPSGSSAAGSTGQLQYNNAGTMGGAAGLYWNGTNLGVGTNTPGQTLEVSGNALVSGYIQAPSISNGIGAILVGTATNLKVGNSAGTTGVNIGPSAGASNTQATNTAVGYQAMNGVTTSQWNTALGYQAMSSATGGSNVAVGHQALRQVSSSGNVAVGDMTLQSLTGGGWNTAVGNQALRDNTASDGTAIGNQALRVNTTGAGNTAVGSMALSSNTTGLNNTAVGKSALTTNVTGSSNAAFGFNAGRLTTASDGTFVGYGAGGTGSVTGGGNTFVGRESGAMTSSGFDNTFLGRNAGLANTTGSDNVYVGNFAGENNNGTGNIFIGRGAARGLTGVNRTLWIGDEEFSAIPIIYGNLSTGRVGINRVTASAALDVGPGGFVVASPAGTGAFNSLFMCSGATSGGVTSFSIPCTGVTTSFHATCTTRGTNVGAAYVLQARAIANAIQIQTNVATTAADNFACMVFN